MGVSESLARLGIVDIKQDGRNTLIHLRPNTDEHVAKIIRAQALLGGIDPKTMQYSDLDPEQPYFLFKESAGDQVTAALERGAEENKALLQAAGRLQVAAFYPIEAAVLNGDDRELRFQVSDVKRSLGAFRQLITVMRHDADFLVEGDLQSGVVSLTADASVRDHIAALTRATALINPLSSSDRGGASETVAGS